MIIKQPTVDSFLVIAEVDCNCQFDVRRSEEQLSIIATATGN